MLPKNLISRFRAPECDAFFAGRLALRQTHLGLPQHPDNLFWGVSLPAHRLLLLEVQVSRTLSISLDRIQGSRSDARAIEKACREENARQATELAEDLPNVVDQTVAEFEAKIPELVKTAAVA
jgi:hypothetical protein